MCMHSASRQWGCIYTELASRTPWSRRQRDVDGGVASGNAAAHLCDPGELARQQLVSREKQASSRSRVGMPIWLAARKRLSVRMRDATAMMSGSGPGLLRSVSRRGHVVVRRCRPRLFDLMADGEAGRPGVLRVGRRVVGERCVARQASTALGSGAGFFL